MVSFYHTHDFLFRSIGDEKLTNILFYIQFFIKFSCLQVCSNATKFYDVLDCLNIGECS